MKGKKKGQCSSSSCKRAVSCKWQNYSEVIQAGKKRKVSNRAAYGESAEGAQVIPALTLLRTGSTFRNKVLLLPVDLGKGFPLKEACFQ